MTNCEHNRIYYIGSMIIEDSLKKINEEMYDKYKNYDLYNCVNCKTTLAIDRRDIASLEKKIIEEQK